MKHSHKTIGQLKPKRLSLRLQWREGGKAKAIFHLDPATYGFLDYEADRQAAEKGENWFVEALESLNLCVDDAVRNAAFDKRRSWRGSVYEARLLTVSCTHCGQKIDLDLIAYTMR